MLTSKQLREVHASLDQQENAGRETQAAAITKMQAWENQENVVTARERVRETAEENRTD